MKISVLASGSSGNSTYVESKGSSILIDAGISARNISNKLSCIGKDISDIDAVFITHEHTDHVKGAERLNRHFDIPVYLNRPTYEYSVLSLKKPKFFLTNKQIKFNDLLITPFEVSHDAIDPCGFKIQNNGETIGVITDFGKPNENIKELANKANCLVLETNHDVDMLINGPYPYHLKQRILGEKGHLSNIDAGLLVKENASENLRKIFLSHLSQHNNTEELALKTFSKLTEKLRLKNIMTRQEENTELFNI